MEQWIPLALLVLVLVVFIGGVLAVPYYFWRQHRQQNDESASPSRIIEMVIRKSGGTFIASSQEQEKRDRSQARRHNLLRHWRPALLLVGLVGGVALVGLWLIPLIQSRLLVDRFVVLVAPFSDEGNGQPVASISDALVRVLEDETEADIVVRQYDNSPASPAEARQIAATNNADLLIWGEVQSGGFLNDMTLLPRLTYAPTGVYAPHAWMSYRGRFHMEDTYRLAHAGYYINGQAVLPPLVDALASYSTGNPDQAYLQLGTLLADYPGTLDPTLLRMLRGNVLWARGNYAEAAEEYRVLGAPEAGPPALAVNLSTIMLDQGMQDTDMLPDALAALNMALPGLEGAAAGTVRYNLGLRALYADDLPEAVAQLDEARALLPDNAELLFALSEAYRESGQLAAAATTLDEAERQINAHLDLVPEGLREPAHRYLQSVHLEQASVLRLSRLVGARGRLAWELYVVPPLPTDEMQPIIDDLRDAATLSHEAMVGWQRQSTTDAVGRNVLASQAGGSMPAEMELGLAALGQRQRVEDQRAHQHYYLAQSLIEEGRTTHRETPGTFEQLWGWAASDERPLVEARSILNEQGNAAPRSLRAHLADARSLLLHSQMPDGDAEMLNQADMLYEQAIQQEPWRPEGFYGRGQVAWLRGDRPTTERLMLQALERDTTFFPARLVLIDFARQDGDWNSVLIHLRTIQQQYNDYEVRLALASTLREAANAGADDARELRNEAEQRLEALTQPTAGSGPERARAWVELGRLYIDRNQEDRARGVSASAGSG
jgi:tetratricopeptide (TPR) repeat protein